MTGRHQQVSRAAELAAERARYEADRAERAFCACEPENRLVARSLEARWEARLAALAEAEQALEAASESLPPLPRRPELEKLAADLPGLWHAPATSSKDRKRLLRTLIADVTLLPEPDQAKVRIGIRWHTGATDELTVARAAHPGTAKRSPPPAVEMVRMGYPLRGEPVYGTAAAAAVRCRPASIHGWIRVLSAPVGDAQFSHALVVGGLGLALAVAQRQPGAFGKQVGPPGCGLLTAATAAARWSAKVSTRHHQCFQVALPAPPCQTDRAVVQWTISKRYARDVRPAEGGHERVAVGADRPCCLVRCCARGGAVVSARYLGIPHGPGRPCAKWEGHGLARVSRPRMGRAA